MDLWHGQIKIHWQMNEPIAPDVEFSIDCNQFNQIKSFLLWNSQKKNFPTKRNENWCLRNKTRRIFHRLIRHLKRKVNAVFPLCTLRKCGKFSLFWPGKMLKIHAENSHLLKYIFSKLCRHRHRYPFIEYSGISLWGWVVEAVRNVTRISNHFRHTQFK